MTVTLFKALSDETRLRLLRILLSHELSVNELVTVLEMGQSRISRHLRILTDAGLLTSRRDGLWVFYHAQQEGEQREFLAAHPELQRRPGREQVFEPDGSTARVDALTKKESGATSGALNDRNDPDMKRRDRHAASYYEEVRRRDTDAEVSRVSRNSGVDAGIVRKAYEHVFIDEHDLADGRHRFLPDYDMSQSWQRLSTGKGIQSHDITLLRHEEAEARFMAEGMSYDEAHAKACDLGYNYAKELREWLDSQNG